MHDAMFNRSMTAVSRVGWMIVSTLGTLVAGALILFLAAPQLTQGAPGEPAPVAPAGVDQVLQEIKANGYKFDPETVTTTVGAAVRWRNVDTTAHTTTSTNGYWNWGLVPGSTYSVRFLTPGTYTYYCMIHRVQGMTGTVVVLGAPLATPGGPTPATPIATAPPQGTLQPGQGAIVYDYPPDEAELQPADLYTIDPSGAGKQRLTDTADMSEAQPRWSPDRRQVVYTASTAVTDTTGPWGLWVLDVATRQRRQITTGPKHYEPTWRPDGGLIAFTNIKLFGSIYGATEIDVVAPDGTGLRPLIWSLDPNSGVVNPAWSPDGTRIAVTLISNLAGGELYVVNVDGSGSRRLFAHPGWDDIDPIWSPNGRYVAFASGPAIGTATTHDIWVLDTKTGVAGTVARHTEWELRRPAWSPDGSYLVFTARFQATPPRWAMYLVPATGGDITGPVGLGREPDWASAALVVLPTPMPGATATPLVPPTPLPLPTIEVEPTQAGPSPTFAPPPTFPPSTLIPPEPTEPGIMPTHPPVTDTPVPSPTRPPFIVRDRIYLAISFRNGTLDR